MFATSTPRRNAKGNIVIKGTACGEAARAQPGNEASLDHTGPLKQRSSSPPRPDQISRYTIGLAAGLVLAFAFGFLSAKALAPRLLRREGGAENSGLDMGALSGSCPRACRRT